MHFPKYRKRRETLTNKMAMKRSQPYRSSPKQKRARAFQRYNSETQFPGKLHDMMKYVEKHGLQSTTISWIRNGTGIIVRDPERLVHILSKFFGQTKYRSFLRQLNMWYFQRITTSGPDKGGFVHPFFVKDRKSLCSLMSRYIDPNELQPSPLSLEAEAQNSDKRAVVPSSHNFSHADNDMLFQEGDHIVFTTPQFIAGSKEDDGGVKKMRMSGGQVQMGDTSQGSPPAVKQHLMVGGGKNKIPSIEERMLDEPSISKLTKEDVFDDIAAEEELPGLGGMLPSRLFDETAYFPQHHEEEALPFSPSSSLLFFDRFAPWQQQEDVLVDEELASAASSESGDEQSQQRDAADVEKSLSSLIDSFVDSSVPLDEKVAASRIPPVDNDGGLVLPGIAFPASPEIVQSLFEELGELEIS